MDPQSRAITEPSPSWVDLRSSSTMETGQTTLAWARDQRELTNVAGDRRAGVLPESMRWLACSSVSTPANMSNRI